MTSSMRCQSVWCDEIIWGLGGMEDGELGGHVDGETCGVNCGSDATYSGAFLYM